MKGGLTATLLTMAACALRRPAGDVHFAAVADEESGSLGMEAVLRRLAQLDIKPDAAIVPEPTNLQLCLAHRGFGWVTLTTHGRAAHTAMRGEGLDAVARMGRVVVALEQLDQSLQTRPAHPLLGRGAVLASLIRGGSELFTYPAECQAEVVRRTLPGENATTIAGEIDELLADLRRQDPRFSASFELKLHRAPLETAADSPIAAALAAAIEHSLGRPPTIVGAPYWTDAGLMAEDGIPTVIFGPSGEGLHSEVEWVSLSSVQTVTAILLGAVRAFCI
jgi:acetylornithine deacetylase